MKKSEIGRYNRQVRQWYCSKTGYQVNIEEIGRNSQTIVLKSKKTLNQIRKDIWLKTDCLDFEDDNFTNVYDLFWESTNRSYYCTIHSEQIPFYLADFVENDASIVATLNGSYFFLIDVKDRMPIEYQYNFCIRDSKIRGLPCSNEPILFTSNCKFAVRETKATGKIKIGKELISWSGSDFVSNKLADYDALLFNSASSKLLKPYDPITGVRLATLDNNNIHTPKDTHKVDLIIQSNEQNELNIGKIVEGGGTHYFDGLFILQIDSKLNSFKVGDKVLPLTLDGIKLANISSGITIGKSVYDNYFYSTDRIMSRDARSVLALDKLGRYHFVVFDGSKYIPKFKGVSARDISGYFAKDRFEWAYFLDGGSSSRIIYRRNESMNFLANELAFKKITLDKFLWDWKRHRKMASCISLNLKI